MGEIKQTIRIAAPLEKVWRIWADVEKTTEWVDGVTESEVTSSVKEGQGLAWKEKCLFGGKKMIQMDHEITEWEAKKHTAIHTGLPMGGTMDRTADFRAAQDGTEVDLTVEWDLGIAGAMIGDDKLQYMMGKSFNSTIAKWKEVAESK